MGKTDQRICKCTVCKKELEVYTEIHSSKIYESSNRVRRTFQDSDSDEGVLFFENRKSQGVWFCNSCWDKIITKVKRDRII